MEEILHMKAIVRLVILLSFAAVFVIGCSSEEAAKQENDNQNQQQLQMQEEQPAAAENSKSDEEKEAQALLPDKKAAVSHGEEVSKEKSDKDGEQAAQLKQQSAAAKQQAVNAKAAVETAKASNKESGQNSATKKAATTSQTSQAKAQAVQQPKQEQNSEVKKQEVTISIKGDAETGVILKSTRVAYESGNTVLDLLKKVTKQNKIQMEYQGSGGTAYIEGIQNLYEFDKGPKSGWMYSVNGIFAKKGAGLTEVKPGDRIEWVYTLDLGKDIGASVNE